MRGSDLKKTEINPKKHMNLGDEKVKILVKG